MFTKQEGQTHIPSNNALHERESLRMQQQRSRSKLITFVPAQCWGQGCQRSPWIQVFNFSKGSALEAKCWVRWDKNFFLLNCLMCWLPLSMPIKMSLGPVSMHSCCMSTKFAQEEKTRGIRPPYKDPWRKRWASLNHPNIKNSTHDFWGSFPPSSKFARETTTDGLSFSLLKSLVFLLLHHHFSSFYPGGN